MELKREQAQVKQLSHKHNNQKNDMNSKIIGGGHVIGGGLE